MTARSSTEPLDSSQAVAKIVGVRELGLLLMALLWLQYFAALAPTWSGGTYYSYGWIVPVLAAWAFIRRWREPPRLDNSAALKHGKLIAPAAILTIVVI